MFAVRLTLIYLCIFAARIFIHLVPVGKQWEAFYFFYIWQPRYYVPTRVRRFEQKFAKVSKILGSADVDKIFLMWTKLFAAATDAIFFQKVAFDGSFMSSQTLRPVNQAAPFNFGYKISKMYSM
jgi:hypothetical protein